MFIKRKQRAVCTAMGITAAVWLPIEKTLHNMQNKLMSEVIKARKCATIGFGNTSMLTMNRLSPIKTKHTAVVPVMELNKLSSVFLSTEELRMLSKASSMPVSNSIILRMPMRHTQPAKMLASKCFVLECRVELNNRNELPDKMKATAVAGFIKIHCATGRLKKATLKSQPHNTPTAIMTTANA